MSTNTSNIRKQHFHKMEMQLQVNLSTCMMAFILIYKLGMHVLLLLFEKPCLINLL